MRILSVQPRNFLTFGPETAPIEGLGDSTAIVGPNGSGKTSLLRAIEYVGLAFNGVAPWAGPYVYRGNPNQGIDIRVTVRLGEDEARLALLGAVLGTFEEVRPNNSQQINVQSATAAVSDILRRSPHLFEPLFEGPICYRAFSTIGYGQALQTYLTFPRPMEELCLDAANRFMIAPVNPRAWGIVSIATEVLSELTTLKPELYRLTPVGPLASPAEMAGVAETLNLDWLVQKLRPRDGHQLSAQLQQLQLGPGSATPPGWPVREQSGELIELIGLLSERIDLPDHISLYGILATIYRSAVVHLSGARFRHTSTSGPPVVDRGTQLPVGQLDEVARALFELKNSWSRVARHRYSKIQESFKSIVPLSFDVVQQPVVLPAESEEKPGRTMLVSQIVFEEGELSYSADFAAAGNYDLLATLYAACGPTDSVLLLDEPALNLHPAKQRALYATLVEDAVNNRNQILTVTHSSTFVSPEDLSHGLRMTLRGGATSVLRLKMPDDRLDAQMVKDVARYPKLLDALFCSCVLLVEGYDEEAGLPPWFLKCDGGEALTNRNVVVLPAASDTAFGRFTRILDAWDCPWRIVADRKALPNLARFGSSALTYPEDDFGDLLQHHYPEQTRRAIAEYAGATGVKDPVVARMVALETSPPEPVKIVWNALKAFIESA